MSTYAIISVGGKQYRVTEGQRLTVDRLKHGAGNTFQPTVLLIGGLLFPVYHVATAAQTCPPARR